MKSMQLEELMLDTEEPTRPSTPSGIRVRELTSAEDYAMAVLQDLLIALKARNTNHARILIEKVECAIQTILSWDHCEPSPDIRLRILNDTQRFNRSALTILGGGR